MARKRRKAPKRSLKRKLTRVKERAACAPTRLNLIPKKGRKKKNGGGTDYPGPMVKKTDGDED